MPPEDPPQLPHDRLRWVGEAVTYWAAREPDRVAVTDSLATLSYGGLEGAVDEARRRLAGLGARPGDRIMVVLENGVLAAVTILAACRLRAWAVPVNARLSPHEIDVIRSHCRPRVTIYACTVSDEARAHARRHEARADPVLGRLGGEVAIDPSVPAEPVDDDPRGQVAALIYTSGTTGAPKGVMLTHDNLGFASSRSSTCRGLCRTDRVYAVLPVSHVMGLASVLLGTLYQGGRLDLVPRFVPEETARALAEGGVTMLQGAPQMHARLLALAKSRARPLHAPTLRYAAAGGAPLDLGLKRQMEAMLGRPLHNGYGMSEASPTIATTRIDRPATDHACGLPLPDVEVRVCDPHGRDVPAGGVGEVRVRGRLVMKGYYRDPAQTAATITADRWLRTGDLGRLGAGGELYVEGRAKELIVRSGFNVFPPEVESVLCEHPDVAMAAVVGRAVAGNEEVVAFVQLVAGRAIDPAALRAFVEPRLAPYKRPSAYVVRDDLPATATGKLVKSALKELVPGS